MTTGCSRRSAARPAAEQERYPQNTDTGSAQMIVDRDVSIRQFESSPIHRNICIQMLTVVFGMLLSCMALVNTLPTAYLNTLVPLTIATGLLMLLSFGNRYQRAVTRMIHTAGLQCERCGQSSIPRPDHVHLSATPQSSEARCYSCGEPLQGLHMSAVDGIPQTT